MQSKTYYLTLTPLFASLIIAASLFTIPFPFTAVPVTLQTCMVCCAGGILGKKYGTFSVLLYLLLGIIGLPVFSGMSSGPGVLLGPTGGYLCAFPLAAFCVGFLTERFNKMNRFPQKAGISLAVAAGMIVIYILGTFHLAVTTEVPLSSAFAAGVLPFLLPDLIKLSLAVLLIHKFKNILTQRIFPIH